MLQVASLKFATRNAHSAVRFPTKTLSKSVASLWYTTSATTPIDLEYYSNSTTDNKTAGAVVILHELFGGSRDWQIRTTQYAKALQRPVYALDLRNHGASKHERPMTYNAMAADVIHFIRKHSLTDVALVGHSMGGKVAMTVALNPSLPASTLSKLIVVDIAPASGKFPEPFPRYVEAMKKIEAANITTKAEARKMWREFARVQNRHVWCFLNAGIIFEKEASRFAHSPEILGESLEELESFPFAPQDAKLRWEGETLFIKGAKSNYLNPDTIPIAEKFFPAMKVQELEGAGHRAPFQKPTEFAVLLTEFIKPGSSAEFLVEASKASAKASRKASRKAAALEASPEALPTPSPEASPKASPEASPEVTAQAPPASVEAPAQAPAALVEA
ncbi:Alpha/Beta hydrolase protein [Mycena vitilis]|nr:Alpha/Beta hydrolase protein [Mycena vitilis]